MASSRPSARSAARDASLWRVPVTYGAVGGTQLEDLIRFPPGGYRAIRRRRRLGHGPERWEHAWTEAMSWGIQRRAGMRVRLLGAPAEAREATYTPVTFGDDGEPLAPAGFGDGEESVYSSSGEALARPGEVAMLRPRLWPLESPVRVVWVVDEPDRRGFAYGTLPGHPERGEESFVVERQRDGSVWLEVSAFSRPAGLGWWLVAPALRLVQAVITARYLRVLGARLPGDQRAATPARGVEPGAA